MGLFVSRLRVLLVERAGVEESLRDLLERSTVALEIGVVSPPAHDVWRELRSHAADWGHRLGRPEEAYQEDSSAPDLLVMSAGIRLPPAWDHEMQAGLHSASCWGTLSPLCDAVPAFRIVEHADGVPEGDRPATMTRCLLRRAGRGVVETPLPLPSCVLIRGGRAAAKAAASGGDWAMIHEAIAEVELEGRVHGLCRHVWVEDPRPERPEWRRWRQRSFEPAIAAWLNAHPLTGLRHEVEDILARFKATDPQSVQPVQLHISHSWEGGLGKWVADFQVAADDRANLVLKSLGTWGAFGSRLVLYGSPGGDEPLDHWDLTQPIRATDVTHPQYRKIVEQVVSQYGVDTVIVSSLIGHSLDVLELNLPTGVVVHDYYPACPVFSMLFDGVCDECDSERMTQCQAHNPENRFFPGIPPAKWQMLREHYAEILERRRIPLVAPTAQAGEHLRRALPHRGRLLVKVIEHGYAAVRPAQVQRRRGEGPLRLVVLGSMNRHKGIELLEEALPRLRGKVEIHFLGCGSDAADRLSGMGAASVVPKYAPEELEALVRDIAPDAGLLASVWPETFCYTLSELWFLGVPPLATRLGSFAERIRDGETGLLFEPHAEGLVTVIERLVKDRSTLDRIAGGLDAVPARSIEQMIADYHELLQPPALLGVFCRGEGYPQRNEADESLELDNPMVAGTGAVVVRRIGSARNLLLGRITTMVYLPAWRRWILRSIVRLWLDLPLQLLGLMHRLRGR
jgi:glycosyltransferase involved in cell wall biosynthesis